MLNYIFYIRWEVTANLPKINAEGLNVWCTERIVISPPPLLKIIIKYKSFQLLCYVAD